MDDIPTEARPRNVKIDTACAFRLIPVHPDDHYLRGMRWNNPVYSDQQLPFGLQMPGVNRTSGVSHVIHILDHFLVLGAPSSGRCKAALDSMLFHYINRVPEYQAGH